MKGEAVQVVRSEERVRRSEFVGPVLSSGVIKMIRKFVERRGPRLLCLRR